MAHLFNGSSSAGEMPHNAAFNFLNTTGTIVCRIKTTSSAFGVIVAKGPATSGSDSPGWAMAINSSLVGRVRFFVKSGNSSGVLSIDRYSGVSTLNDGQWHSIILTFTTSSSSLGGNVASMWVDGTLSNSDGTVTEAYGPQSTGPLIVGARGPSGAKTNFYNGELADLAIYSGDIGSDLKRAHGFKGVAANRLGASGLMFYAPLIRSGINVHNSAFSLSGTTVTNHPRIHL